MSKERNKAEHALKQADMAARRGDLHAAERWSKTAERMVEAAERLHESAPEPEVDVEELRREFVARLKRLAEAETAQRAWESERELYETQVAEARRDGGQMPESLRKSPYTDEDIERIAAGKA